MYTEMGVQGRWNTGQCEAEVHSFICKQQMQGPLMIEGQNWG
jgi:hypothetical protein